MNSICGKISIGFFKLYVGSSPSILFEKRQRLVVPILMVIMFPVCVALTCVCFVALSLPLMSNC